MKSAWKSGLNELIRIPNLKIVVERERDIISEWTLLFSCICSFTRYCLCFFFFFLIIKMLFFISDMNQRKVLKKNFLVAKHTAFEAYHWCQSFPGDTVDQRKQEPKRSRNVNVQISEKISKKWGKVASY